MTEQERIYHLPPPNIHRSYLTKNLKKLGEISKTLLTHFVSFHKISPDNNNANLLSKHTLSLSYQKMAIT